jgi:hypothetical protein
MRVCMRARMPPARASKPFIAKKRFRINPSQISPLFPDSAKERRAFFVFGPFGHSFFEDSG